MSFKLRQLIVVCSVSILGFVSLSPAQAADTVGGSCAKVGTKSQIAHKNVLCTKSGSKLIWKVVAATATVSPKVPAAPAAPAKLLKITINESGHTLSDAPLYLARDLGFFKAEGLDVNIVATGGSAKSVAPLIGGSSQVCSCIFTHPLNAVVAGAGDLKVFGAVMSGYNHQVVIRPEIAKKLGVTGASPLKDRIAALKGLKIGITQVGASTDQVIRLILEAGGMDPSKDVTLVTLGNTPNLPPALAQKRVDAFILVPPVPQQSVSSGDGIILVDVRDDDIGGGLQTAFYEGLTARADYIAKNRPTVLKIYRAVAKAEAYLANNWDAAMKVIHEKEFPELTDAAMADAASGVKGLFPANPALDQKGIESALKLANKFSKVPVKITFADISDLTIGRDAAG